MTSLYDDKSHISAKRNAQLNLDGRTHYVDDDTLRYHHSRVLRAGHSYGGLLFWIIESVALDCHNTKRAFRYVIFDLFGRVVGTRASLGAECYRTSNAARKAMSREMDTLDPVALTKAGAESERRNVESDLAYVDSQVQRLIAEGKVLPKE